MKVSLPQQLRQSPLKMRIVEYAAAHTPVGYTTLRRDCATSLSRGTVLRLDFAVRELVRNDLIWIEYDNRGWRIIGITQTGRRALYRVRTQAEPANPLRGTNATNLPAPSA